MSCPWPCKNTTGLHHTASFPHSHMGFRGCPPFSPWQHPLFLLVSFFMPQSMVILLVFPEIKPFSWLHIFHCVCEFLLHFFVSVKHANESSSSTEVGSWGKWITWRGVGVCSSLPWLAHSHIWIWTWPLVPLWVYQNTDISIKENLFM